MGYKENNKMHTLSPFSSRQDQPLFVGKTRLPRKVTFHFIGPICYQMYEKYYWCFPFIGRQKLCNDMDHILYSLFLSFSSFLLFLFSWNVFSSEGNDGLWGFYSCKWSLCDVGIMCVSFIIFICPKKYSTTYHFTLNNNKWLGFN